MTQELKVTVEEPTPVTRALTVEVPPEQVAEAFAAVLKEYRRKAALPGFRRGKVPPDMIRRLYWGDVTADVARRLLPEQFEKALEQTALAPLSEPEFELHTLEEGQPFSFSARFEIKPRFELGDYLGLEVEAESTEVRDEEVERLLGEIRESHAKVVKLAEPRGLRDGDVALIDFEGSVEGRAVPGGAGKDHTLVIGSNSFPPGFEDNLIGAMPGETREFGVRLPEQFPEASLAGKDALFKVTVKEISERVLPALDDEFAKDVGDYQGLEDLTAKVRENLRATKEAAARGSLRNKVVARLIEATPFEVPPTLLEARRRMIAADAERYLLLRGVPWEEIKKSRESIHQDAGPAAERRAKASLILEAIADREGITAGEEDVAAEIARLAQSNRMEPAEVRRRLVENGTLESLREMLREEKALDFVVEKARTV